MVYTDTKIVSIKIVFSLHLSAAAVPDDSSLDQPT